MRVLFVLSFCLIGITSFAQKKKQTPFIRDLPVPHKAVNDFGKFLTDNEKQYLEKELTSYHKKTTNAIVIITLDSLTDAKTKREYTVEETAQLYFNKWGIGDSIKNNGVLLLVSRKPRRVRIETDAGIQDVLTNDICQHIIDEKLVPSFKQGLFFLGLKNAVEALEQQLDNQPAPQTLQIPASPVEQYTEADFKGYTPESSSGDWLIIVLFFGSIAAMFVWVFRVASKGRLDLISSRGYRSHYRYNDSGFHDSSYYDSSYSNTNNDSIVSFSSDSSSSDSSSSSSFGSYSGGSSDGGGASGSW